MAEPTPSSACTPADPPPTSSPSMPPPCAPALARRRSWEERPPVLQGAAEAIAEALVAGAPLKDRPGASQGGRQPVLRLRDALMAENAACSEACAARCASIRSSFAVAMRAALGERARAAPLLRPAPSAAPRGDGASAPRVRIEVRHTAGRLMEEEVFTIGRACECDVQTSGDCTVSRLQLVVVSLPGCILVVDAWSSSGTRVVKRSGGPGRLLPASVPAARTAFVLPHGERVVLLVGAKTTVTLGPAEKDLQKMKVPPPVELPPPPPPSPVLAVAPVVAAAPAASAVAAPAAAPAATPAATPAAVAAPAVAAAPNAAFTIGASVVTCGRAMMRAGEDLASAPLLELPPGTRCLVLERGAGPTGRRLRVRREATGQEGWLSCMGKSGNVLLVRATIAGAGGPGSQGAEPAALQESPPEGGGRAAVAAAANSPSLQRCLATVRASVRLQQAATARERLRWRLQAARRARLLAEEQCAELEDRLQPGHDQAMDEVRDILDGLGVPPAPDEPTPVGCPPWTCVVCSTSQRTRGWRCPFRHRFCRDCMVKRGEAEVHPRCPKDGCGYHLGEHDLQDLRVKAESLEAFRAGRLGEGLAALKDGAESQATVFRCPGAGCSAAVVLGFGEARRRWACACGAPPACTGCGTSPYHYHAQCDEVQSLRARWLAWLQGGREAYKGLERRTAREATAQQRALREAMARHAELARDEGWKAEHCRLCPRCNSAVEKVDGCDAIVCGQSVPGGTRQPGCGHRFTWQDAKPYEPSVGRAPRMSPYAQPALARRGAVSGRGVRHLFAQCGLCGSGGKCIVGPRFRCIHCQAFSVCAACEPKLAEQHQEGHVFEVMFEDDLDWGSLGVDLPRGTRARIRSSAVPEAAPGGAAPPVAGAAGGRKRRAPGGEGDDAGLEGVLRGQKKGKYVLELPDGAGTRLVAPENVQPLLTQRQAERLLEEVPAPFAVDAGASPAPLGRGAASRSGSGGSGGRRGSRGGRGRG